MVDRIRGRHWSLASAAVDGESTEIRVDAGDDPVSETTLFQIGSITKTMTGVLLGEACERGEARLETTLGDAVGLKGNCAPLTLEDLAAQRHGLPRLPPNLDAHVVDRADPYADYSEELLLEAAEAQGKISGGTYGYSNYAFMLLGLALGRLAAQPYADLVRSRVFEPLGMTTAICGTPGEGSDAIPGWAGGERTPWWSTQLPGPGGVGASITDVVRYLEAHLRPESTPLGPAIARATEIRQVGDRAMGLGWHHLGGGWWHNGGTGGFRSFAAFHRPSGCAVALLANDADASLDDVAIAVLTDMVRRHS